MPANTPSSQVSSSQQRNASTISRYFNRLRPSSPGHTEEANGQAQEQQATQRKRRRDVSSVLPVLLSGLLRGLPILLRAAPWSPRGLPILLWAAPWSPHSPLGCSVVSPFSSGLLRGLPILLSAAPWSPHSPLGCSVVSPFSSGLLLVSPFSSILSQCYVCTLSTVCVTPHSRESI